jgi:hypothetical protein
MTEHRLTTGVRMSFSDFAESRLIHEISPDLQEGKALLDEKKGNLQSAEERKQEAQADVSRAENEVSETAKQLADKANAEIQELQGFVDSVSGVANRPGAVATGTGLEPAELLLALNDLGVRTCPAYARPKAAATRRDSAASSLQSGQKPWDEDGVRRRDLPVGMSRHWQYGAYTMGPALEQIDANRRDGLVGEPDLSRSHQRQATAGARFEQTKRDIAAGLYDEPAQPVTRPTAGTTRTADGSPSAASAKPAVDTLETLGTKEFEKRLRSIAIEQDGPALSLPDIKQLTPAKAEKLVIVCRETRKAELNLENLSSITSPIIAKELAKLPVFLRTGIQQLSVDVAKALCDNRSQLRSLKFYAIRSPISDPVADVLLKSKKRIYLNSDMDVYNELVQYAKKMKRPMPGTITLG